MLENSALETLYGGQFTPSTQLIKTNDPSLSACLSVCLSVCLSLPSCLPFHSLSVYLVHLYLSAFHFTFSNHLLYTSAPFPSSHSVSHHIAYFGTRSSFSENTLSETMVPFVFVVVLCKDTYGKNTT